jgi:hypothetical protein
MVQRLSFCLCTLLLLAGAGSAFAQTPPPFTFGFTQSQYSGLENDRFVAVFVVVTGPVPDKTPFQVTLTQMPSGHVQTFDLIWSTIFSENPRRISVYDDDLYYNPGRSYVAKIVSVGNGGAIVEPSTATVTITDNEVPPTVSINDVTIVEGTPQPGMAFPPRFANFTVSLASAFPTAVTVPVFLHDNSAKRGHDYEGAATQFVVFGPQEQSKSLSILIDSDTLPEGDETFALELQPQFPVLAGKTIGTCTILDDDEAVSPPFQKVAIGEKGIVNIRLTDPAVADEHVILQASDPTMFAVPASVTIPAGASEASAEFLCLKVGAGSVLVTLPPSRGGRTYELSVTVHDTTILTVDPIQLNMSLGASANVTARVDPLPAGPLRVLFTPVKNGLVSVPDVILTGADGRAVIPVRAIGLGSTAVTLSLLDINGGASTTLGINVTLGPGPVVTSLVPATGRASGGNSVFVNGFNFSNPCTLSLGGVPVPVTSVQPGSNSIYVVTPPHDPGIADLSIRCGTRSFVFPNAFSYQAAPVKSPRISPKSGTIRGGTLVGVSGTDLRYQSCVARFGSVTASLIASHETTGISVSTPPHAAGSVDVSLVCGSETVTLPGAFSYVAADDPPVSSFSTYSPEQGKSALISTQAGFRLDDEVLINGVVVPHVTTPESDFHVFTMPDIAGQAELTLRDYAGRAITRTITVNPPGAPLVTTLPDHIALGAEFSVNNENSGLRPGLTYLFGPALVQLVRDPTLSYADHSVCWGCVLPPVFRVPISVGPGKFSFTIADHGTVVVTKTIEVTTSGPVVSTATPPCAVYDGGSLVTISGSGFDDGAAVRFAATYAPEVIVKDHFTIIAKVPPSYGTLNPQIAVINPDGTTATLTNAFHYQSPSEPACGGGGRHHAAGH